MRQMMAMILGMVCCFGCTAQAEPPTKESKITSLIPTNLDPAIQKQAAAILDRNMAVRERAISAMSERKMQAVPYLLEICLDDDGLPRPEVAPLLGKLLLVQRRSGSSFDPLGSKILAEAITHSSSDMRRGAAGWLLLEATVGDDCERVVALLQERVRKDANEKVRSKASESLQFIAVELVANRILNAAANGDNLENYFKTLETIGEPALDILSKFLTGLEADLEETEQLRRIRRGIGGEDTPEILGQIRIYSRCIGLSRTTMRAIENRIKADK